MIEVLKRALADAKLNERHQTIAESYYWLRQYKLLAEKAIAELESQEPFGIWHQGATDEESDFYLYSESGDVSCPTCIKLYTTPPQRTEPTCPDCKAVVLYECVACSSNNYPPKETT